MSPGRKFKIHKDQTLTFVFDNKLVLEERTTCLDATALNFIVVNPQKILIVTGLNE
jgi:hypothetical protein